MSNANKLSRLQEWIGIDTLGVYLGIETYGWDNATFQAYINGLAAAKPDVLYIKIAEWGREWYNGHFTDIRRMCLDAGIGCAPYVYCRPQTWQADAIIAARAAINAGGVVLDIENEWKHYDSLASQFVNRVRALAGAGPRILVTGYGDPVYAPSVSFSAFAEADGYQPQWYIGYWDIYHTRGWNAAINWADGQCYQAFMAGGLGSDYPIAPLVNVEGVAPTDLAAISRYLRAWQCGLAVWEARDVTEAERLAIAGALHAQ